LIDDAKNTTMSVLATRLKCRAAEISEGWLGKPVYRSQQTSAAFLNTLDVRTTRDRRRALAADASHPLVKSGDNRFTRPI
jgi:hypothetical protein